MIGSQTGWQALQDALARSSPACEGDERFISDGRTPTLSADLAVICAACPVLTACRTYATKARPHAMAGFWGGHWRGKPSQHE
ncbi:WhiB family transcriptional regulator [Microbacterium aurugineum]